MCSSLQQYVEKYNSQPNVMEFNVFIKNNNTTVESLKDSVIEKYKTLMLDDSVQNKEFFVKYAEAQKNRTPEQIEEERFEMRAAFGPGETVVNIVTDEEVIT